MKTCMLCFSTFPNWATIDNKRRNLSSRKYCIDCSPFGSHNTSNLEKKATEPIKNTCSKCSRVFLYKRNKGHTKTHCNSCLTVTRRHKRQAEIIKLGGGACQKCGYNKCARALCFHHLDPATKEFNISGKETLNWDRIVAEAKKCILLCMNCHVETHDELEKAHP